MALIANGQGKQTNDSGIESTRHLSLCSTMQIIHTYPSLVPMYKSLVRLLNGFVNSVASLFVSIHSI